MHKILINSVDIKLFLNSINKISNNAKAKFMSLKKWSFIKGLSSEFDKVKATDGLLLGCCQGNSGAIYYPVIMPH